VAIWQIEFDFELLQTAREHVAIASRKRRGLASRVNAILPKQ
jgi:hypothetical protein